MSMQLSSWAIRRPIPTIVLFLVLAIAGWTSFLGLPINANPRVDFPVVTVAVPQVGAAPTELEHAVTLRVERAVSGLAGIRHITSTVADGISITTVEFQLGIDPGRAANDIRDAIAQIRADLPQTIEEPIITRVDIEGGAILNYAVSTQALGLVDVSWFVDDVVSRELLSVPGVQKVQRLGGVEREVRVALRADRLEALGLGADQVNAQLLRANANVPGGRAAGAEQSIRALGSAASVQALGATPIALPTAAGRGSTISRSCAMAPARRARGPGWTARRWWASPCSAPRGPAIHASRRAWSTPWNNCAASTPTSTSSWCPRPWPIRWPATTRPS